jgi:HYDIN/CFA65/VesB family protein
MKTVSKWLAAVGFAYTSFAGAQTAVLQRGYDAGVSGANLTETTLNTSTVGSATFGLLFKLPVDDVIFAQPLYVPNVAVANQGTHNVVYVATMSDSLYAFDADAGGAPLWSINLASLVGATPVPFGNFTYGGNLNIVGNLGVLSTPVIDPATNLMYVVACTLEGGAMAYRLHAVDITSGAEPLGPGVLITGTYGGLTFAGSYQLQRLSLALSGNQVVFAFSAIEEETANPSYAGWVMAYNKGTLQQSGIFATQTTKGGGVWQSGRPPVVDGSGYVYLFTGNGYTNGYDGVANFSESALKLDPSNGLSLLDWFTPDDWSSLDADDTDLTSSGPLLIPGTTLIAGGGKAGVLYVLNTSNLGKFNSTDSQIVQEETIAASEIHGGPVFWQRSAANGGPLLYDWAMADVLKAYSFNGATFAASPSMQRSDSVVFPGGILTLSANGEQPGSGVLWATVPTGGDAENNPPVGGKLRAFDAQNLSNELWNSSINSSRDGFGNLAKFVPPVVANGKVYVATWSSQVAVYGLLPLLPSYSVSPTSLTFGTQLINSASAPKPVTVTNTGPVPLPVTSITLSSSGSQPFSQTNNCGTSVAVGATCTVNVVFDPNSAGAAGATLSVNAGGTRSTVSLSGSGTFQVTLTPSSTTTMVGVPVTLTWSSAPGASCVASGGGNRDGWSGSTFAASGSQSVSEASAGNYAFTLKCTANGVSATATVSVTVTPPPTATLSATPTSIFLGQSSTLTWTSANAASCVASGGQAGDGWAGAKAVNGTATVTPTATGTITYTISCSSGSLAAQANAQVVVKAQALTVSLSAAPTSIGVGQSSTLSWTSASAASCVAIGGQAGDGWAGAKAANGTATVTPAAAGNFTYTISCSSGSQSAQANTQVAVMAQVIVRNGGGAFDGLALLSLLTMLGLRQRRRNDAGH